MMLLFNTDKLEKVGDHMELHDINPGGNVRSPLVTRLRSKSTGEEFFVMVNHLYRKRADRRREQAKKLNEWARAQVLPVIAVGDYNFDWRSDTDHGEGLTLLTQDDVFEWLKPSNAPLPTQCHPVYKSILDFVFVSGAAQDWTASAKTLFPEASYCVQSNKTSDHRPVEAVLELPDGVGPVEPEVDAIAELREAVTALEAALAEVKAKLAALEANPQ